MKLTRPVEFPLNNGGKEICHTSQEVLRLVATKLLPDSILDITKTLIEGALTPDELTDQLERLTMMASRSVPLFGAIPNEGNADQSGKGNQFGSGIVIVSSPESPGEKLSRIYGELAKAESKIEHLLSQFSKLEQGFASEIAEIKARQIEELDGLKNLYTDALEERRRELEGLQAAFREKVQVDAAVNYWRGRARQHRCESRTWGRRFFVFLILSIAVVIFSGPSWLSRIHAAGQNALVEYGFIGFVALGAIWALRHLARRMVSEEQLATDAEQRATMTETYLALVKETAHAASEAERIVVLNALFRPLNATSSDDGLPPNIADLLTRVKPKEA